MSVTFLVKAAQVTVVYILILKFVENSLLVHYFVERYDEKPQKKTFTGSTAGPGLPSLIYMLVCINVKKTVRFAKVHTKPFHEI